MWPHPLVVALGLPRVVAFSLPLGLTGCAPDPVPAQPTWVEHVEPILRGNCFHCHGGAAPQGDVGRWDVYDKLDPQLARIGNFADSMISGKDPAHFIAIRGFVDPGIDEARRMPPAPATRLTQRDLLILDGWRTAGFPRGQRQPNRVPTIRWLDPPSFFVVNDEDREQVLGRIDCQGGQMLLPRSGAFILPDDLAPPCSAILYDGQDLVEGLGLP